MALTGLIWLLLLRQAVLINVSVDLVSVYAKGAVVEI